MIEMYVNILVAFARDVALLEQQAVGLATNKNGPITDDDVAILEPLLERCSGAGAFFYLPQVVARRNRLQAAIDQRASYEEIRYQLRALREELDDELGSRKLFYMPASKALYYFTGLQEFGLDVLKRFPSLRSDIEEAGKCIGCRRSTAAVFHLMRVLEAGVQAFGKQFGLAGLEHKNWQEILNDVNGKLRAMVKTDSQRAQFAELVTLLTAVKFAWRNEVMHPKDVYTEEEADDIFRTTRAFMKKVVEACPLPSAATSLPTVPTSAP